MRIAPEMITNLATDEVFVFGSNKEGLHAGGAAKVAMKWGAEWGNGFGLQGHTYAIPTLSYPGGSKGHMLSLEEINGYVQEFIAFAKQHPEYKFMVTPIGCGIAGFTEEQIAPMFKNAVKVKNIYLPKPFLKLLVPGILKLMIRESIENAYRENWVYMGVFLDDASRQLLEKKVKGLPFVNIPKGWRMYCHHMTLAFNNHNEQSQKIFDNYAKGFGLDVDLVASEIGISDKAIAVKINWTNPSGNKINHITVAVSPDGKPVDSNKITRWQSLPFPLKLKGKLGYFVNGNVYTR